MCGIVGIVRFDGQIVSEDYLQPLLRELAHRGPDGSGAAAQGSIGIAMARLAIIDVAGGQQPIFNETGDIAIVCNGEIYNYQELRAALEGKGHRFRTHSDVETILHLYEDHGADCFRHLNGMFGVAIADFRQQRVVLARDPFGQKSLYVWRHGSQLVFSSEQKAIARLPHFSRRLNPEAISSFLEWRYVPSPQSIFADVEKIQPGSSWSINVRTGDIDRRRYWRADYGPPHPPPSNPADMREQLQQAVGRHLMSERPLGVFLSGGLDSSALVASMHALGHRQIHTYSVGFPGYRDDELAEAKRVATHFQTEHREVVVTPESFWENLASAVFSADEPMADLTIVPVYLLSKAAREDVVVVLSGEGSDELLAGYGGMEQMQALFERMQRLRKWTRLVDWLPLKGLRDRVSPTDYLVRNALAMTNVFPAAYRREHTTQPVYAGTGMLDQLRSYYGERKDWEGVPLYLGALLESWLPEDLLLKADRMSMAHSLELRSPFLDMDFYRYCRALPLSDKVSSANEEPNRKIALKRAFDSVLPPGVAMQRKKGFAIPMYEWLRDHYAGRMRDELEKPGTLSAEIFRPAARAAIAAGAVAGDPMQQHRAWSLMILNHWGRCWL